jgi:hypothetical protein
MEWRASAGCPVSGPAPRKRSRITSDFESPRVRDSASISVTSGSGSRIVIVFTLPTV